MISVLKLQEAKTEVIKLKKTRKAFLLEYVCGVLLIGLGVMAISKNLMNGLFLKSVFAFGFISLASAELSRMLIRYKITPEKVIITQGIVRKHKKNIHFHPLGFVPDINVKQNVLQRFLNYGTVFVQDSGQHQLEIKDVNNPHKILTLLEDYIELNRAGNSNQNAEPKDLLNK